MWSGRVKTGGGAHVRPCLDGKAGVDARLAQE
jgi:hypothetical protein